MSKFNDAVAGKKFRCDSCKQIVEGEKIILRKSSDNISMVNQHMTFKFVDKDGNIIGGSNGPDGKKGDQVAHCPLCECPHLFGFDLI